MSKRSDAVKRWRENTKKRMVEAMGGQCAHCGYNRCHDALEFHHLDPNEKDFQLSSVRANPKSWAGIVNELRKCVMLCANCHRELHDNMIVLSEIPKFCEVYDDYRQVLREQHTSSCPVCGGIKYNTTVTCSVECGRKHRYKGDWENVDLIELKKTHSFIAIADMLGVSDVTVAKRYRRLTSSA